MSHEVSRTVRRDGKWWNVKGVGMQGAGNVTQGPFDTETEAIEHAKARSRVFDAWESQPLKLEPLDELMRKGTQGSAPFSKTEIHRGYRRLGVGK